MTILRIAVTAAALMGLAFIVKICAQIILEAIRERRP